MKERKFKIEMITYRLIPTVQTKRMTSLSTGMLQKFKHKSVYRLSRLPVGTFPTGFGRLSRHYGKL